jgi:hypothetical protein
MQGEGKSIDGEIERNQWKICLDEFSKRNQSRPTRLEVVGIDIGAQEEERYLPFIGISFEPKGGTAGSVEIHLGSETTADSRQVNHFIPNVEHIYPITGLNSVEDGLGIEDKDKIRTLLLFEVLREIPDNTSDTR